MRRHRAGVRRRPGVSYVGDYIRNLTLEQVWTLEGVAHRRGVDGLITNYPDRLRDLLAERGSKLPKPTTEPAGIDGVDDASAA